MKTFVRELQALTSLQKKQFTDEFYETFLQIGRNAVSKVSPDPQYKLMYGKEIFEFFSQIE